MACLKTAIKKEPNILKLIKIYARIKFYSASEEYLLKYFSEKIDETCTERIETTLEFPSLKEEKYRTCYAIAISDYYTFKELYHKYNKNKEKPGIKDIFQEINSTLPYAKELIKETQEVEND